MKKVFTIFSGAFQIFSLFFWDSLARDLFKNGLDFFTASKFDFIWIFEIFAVLKTSNPVGCSTARYDLVQLVQWEGVEWSELIRFVSATSLDAQNTHTSVLTGQESPDRANQPCTPVWDRIGWKPATLPRVVHFTSSRWKIFFLQTFLRAQAIF